VPRRGAWGYGIADVELHAFRADREQALAAQLERVREIERNGELATDSSG
jgi:hypothetical protein